MRSSCSVQPSRVSDLRGGRGEGEGGELIYPLRLGLLVRSCLGRCGRLGSGTCDEGAWPRRLCLPWWACEMMFGSRASACWSGENWLCELSLGYDVVILRMEHSASTRIGHNLYEVSDPRLIIYLRDSLYPPLEFLSSPGCTKLESVSHAVDQLELWMWLVEYLQPHVHQPQWHDPNLTRTSSLIQKFGSCQHPTYQTSLQHDTMLSRMVRRRLLSSAMRTRSPPGKGMQRRWLTPAPRPGDGPLMSRRADRELPCTNRTPNPPRQPRR